MLPLELIPIAPHSMPSWRSMLRPISAIRTWRLTCVGEATVIRFTTRAGSSTNWPATCMTLAASSGVLTDPVMTSDWSTVVAVMFCPGATLAMPCSRAFVLCVTRICADISTLSSSSTANSDVSPTPTPVR